MIKLKKILPFVYAIICALPTVLGFGAISAVLLSGLLGAEYVKKTPINYALLLVFSGICMFLCLYGHIYYTVAYVAIILASSLSVGICIKGKKNLSAIIITTSLCTVTIFLVIIVYYMKKYNISAVDAVFGTYLDTLTAAAELAGDMAAQILAIVSEFRKQIDLILPSLIIVAGSIFSYISFGIARMFIEKNSQKLDIRPFYLLRLSTSFTFIFIIADMISMFMGTNVLFANVSVVLTTLFVICGISVIDFHLRMKGVKNLVRTIIYIAAFFLVIFTGFIGTIAINILHFIGLIDSLRPLRRVNGNKF